jgi:N6-L-threonylcarbamoyladenine synthase
LIPVNHIIAHLFAFAIDRKEPIKYPFIGLVVSGGHTIIYLFKNINEYQILTKTADDAAGETLDKIGRTLGFKYPGGIAIDHNYQSRNANVKLINHADPTNDFSFSGIKTKILSDYQKNKNTKITLASSALKWIVDDILIKLNFYVKKYHVTNIVVGGGVSANRLLRKLLTQKYRRVHLPLLPYCQDNAAMIGAYGYLASIKTLR